MGQADLPEISMSLLRAIEIGHPEAQPMIRHDFGDHAGGAAVADHVDHYLIILKYPIPLRAAIDAHRGLVRADDARAAQAGENASDLVVKAGFRALQHGVRRTLADPQG